MLLLVPLHISIVFILGYPISKKFIKKKAIKKTRVIALVVCAFILLSLLPVVFNMIVHPVASYDKVGCVANKYFVACFNNHKYYYQGDRVNDGNFFVVNRRGGLIYPLQLKGFKFNYGVDCTLYLEENDFYDRRSMLEFDGPEKVNSCPGTYSKALEVYKAKFGNYPGTLNDLYEQRYKLPYGSEVIHDLMRHCVYNGYKENLFEYKSITSPNGAISDYELYYLGHHINKTTLDNYDEIEKKYSEDDIEAKNENDRKDELEFEIVIDQASVVSLVDNSLIAWSSSENGYRALNLVKNNKRVEIYVDRDEGGGRIDWFKVIDDNSVVYKAHNNGKIGCRLYRYNISTGGNEVIYELHNKVVGNGSADDFVYIGNDKYLFMQAVELVPEGADEQLLGKRDWGISLEVISNQNTQTVLWEEKGYVTASDFSANSGLRGLFISPDYRAFVKVDDLVTSSDSSQFLLYSIIQTNGHYAINTEKVFNNAILPVWKDANTLLYVSTNDNCIHKYDLLTEEEVVLLIEIDDPISYVEFNHISNTMLIVDDKIHGYIYSLEDKKTVKITQGYYLLNWTSSHEILAMIDNDIYILDTDILRLNSESSDQYDPENTEKAIVAIVDDSCKRSEGYRLEDAKSFSCYYWKAEE